MVADPEKETPLARKPTIRRHRRSRRESPLVWWIVFAALGLVALFLWSWRLLLITLALWCVYELCLVPTLCRVVTRQGVSCGRPVRGRVFGCEPGHQEMKTGALRRLIGLRPPRKAPAADGGPAPATPYGAPPPHDAAQAQARAQAQGAAQARGAARPHGSPQGHGAAQGSATPPPRAAGDPLDVVVWSPQVRGGLESSDRTIL